MPIESYMQGRPDELMERAQSARAKQRKVGGGWSPALDRLESFAYSNPVNQNNAFADAAQSDASGPLSQWDRYGAVLNARGAQLDTPDTDLRSSLPAGYTENALDDELNSFATTGRVGGQGMTSPALKGLESAGKYKPEDRTKIAGQVRSRMLPGGRII